MGPRQLHLEVPKEFEGPNGVGMVWDIHIIYIYCICIDTGFDLMTDPEHDIADLRLGIT